MGRLEKLPTLMYANGRGIKLAIYLFLMAETALIGGRCWDLHLISSRVEQSEVRVHSDTAAAVVWDHSNGGWDHFPSRHGLCSQARLCCAVSNVAAWVPVPVPPGVCGITRRLGVAGFVAKHTPLLFALHNLLFSVFHAAGSFIIWVELWGQGRCTNILSHWNTQKIKPRLMTCLLSPTEEESEGMFSCCSIQWLHNKRDFCNESLIYYWWDFD